MIRSVHLYTAVTKIFILSEVGNANKSIRIAQLTFEHLRVAFCRSKVVGQTSLFTHTLKLTGLLRIHFYFPDRTSVQLSSWYRFSEANSFKIWHWNTAYTINNCAHKTKYQKMHVHFERRWTEKWDGTIQIKLTGETRQLNSEPSYGNVNFVL